MTLRAVKEKLSSRNRSVLWVCFLAWVLLSNMPVWAQEIVAGEPSENISFRRIFVPADSPELWPIASSRYLPIKDSNLEALLQSTKEASEDHHPKANCSAAHYHAKLVGNSLVGTAELDIEKFSESSQVFALAPLNLLITSAYWLSEPNRPAVLGQWKLAKNQVTAGVLVEKAGHLLLNWTLKPQEDQKSLLKFLIESPNAATSRLSLILPRDAEPEISSGVVSRVDSINEDGKKWEIVLVPGTSHLLTIRVRSETRETLGPPRVSQSDSHTLELQGLSSTFRYHVDTNGPSQNLFRAIVPDNTRITSVQVNDEEISWSTATNDVGQTELLVPLTGTKQLFVVEVRSHSELQELESWVLPKLVPQDVLWTEGSTGIYVASSLELQSIFPTFSTLQHVVGIQNQEGEVFRLLDWSKNSMVNVVVARRAPRLFSQSVTTTKWDAENLRARCLAFLSSSHQGGYHVEAVIHPEWTVEKVACEPNATLQDWNVYHDKREQILRLHFQEPITKNAPLQLEILAAGPSELIRPRTKISNLKFLNFRNATVLEDFLFLTNSQGKSESLSLSGDSPTWDIQALPMHFAALLPSEPQGLLLNLSTLGTDATVTYRSEPIRYQGQVRVTTSILPTTIEHSYRIECSPLSGRISEIVLQSDFPLPTDLTWRILGHSGQVSLDSWEAPSSEDPFTAISKYILRLPTSFNTPITLTASYSTPRQESERCNLLQLPSAKNWQGLVFLRGTQAEIQLLDEGWNRAIPWDITPEMEDSLPILASYRYEAEDLRSNAPLVVQASLQKDPVTPALANVLCSRAAYESWQATDGTTVYIANYQLDNVGSKQVTILLPEDAELVEGALENRPLTPSEILVDDQLCTFVLTDPQGRQSISVKYTTQDDELGISNNITPKFPKCSFPISRSQWTLSIPRQYVFDLQRLHQTSETTGLRHRLFQPLLPSPDSKPFHPLQRSSWQELLSTPKVAVQIDARPEERDENLEPSTDFLTANASDSELRPLTWDESLSLAQLHNVNRTAHGLHSISFPSFRSQSITFVNTPPTVGIHHAYARQTQKILVFLLAMIAGIWIYQHLPKTTILACVASMVLCLLAPGTWLAFSQAIFLGLLFSLLLRGFRYSWTVSQTKPFPSHSRSRSTIFLLLAFIIPYIAVPETAAQNLAPEAKSSTSFEALPKILIPVDSKGKTKGSERFIEEAFLKKIQQWQRDRKSTGAQYVITGVQLQGEPGPQVTQANSEELSTQKRPWKLQITLKSFTSGAILHLPVHQSDALWLNDSYRLDGLPTTVSWDAKGHSCQIELGVAGNHQVELVFEPKVLYRPGKASFTFHVPKCPRTEVDIKLGDKVSEVDVSGVTTSQTDTSNGRWIAQVAPSESLEVSWNLASDSIAKNLTGNIEQLSWLQVEPASAQLQVQYQFRSTPKLPRTLRIFKSRHLTLLPPDTGTGIRKVTELTKEVILLELETTAASDQKIDLKFDLQRSVSLGQIFFPEVRLLDFSPSRNLFAVSVASNLSYDESLTDTMRSIPPDEFSKNWGTDTTPPLYAYALDQHSPEWSLNIWPTPRTYAAQQTLRVYLGASKVNLEYEAAFEQIRGNVLIHRFNIPSNLTVNSVDLTSPSSTQPIPLRWSRVNGAELVVILGQPLNKMHRLNITGEFLLPPERILELPRMGLIGAERNNLRMDLYRNKDILVRWSDPQKKPQEIVQQSRVRNHSEIQIGQYVWRPIDRNQYSALQVEKNELLFHADTCITMKKSTQLNWEATLHARIQAKKGILDELVIRVPKDFPGPYQVEPSDAGTIAQTVEDEFTRKLTILLSKPLQEGTETNLRLRGVLDGNTSQQLTAPQLRLLGANKANRFLLLPSSDGENSIAWKRTQGLRRQTLPADLHDLIGDHLGQLSYRIQRSNFLAQQRSHHGTLRHARMRYNWITGLLDRHDTLSATAHLVLQPGSSSTCELKLPPNSELLSLKLGDQHVLSERTEEGLWKIALGHAYLPRNITVTYCSQLKQSLPHRPLLLRPPRILIGDQTLPLEKTYWSLQFAENAHAFEPIVGRPIESHQFLPQLLDLQFQTIGDASSQLLEMPAGEALAWFKQWDRSVASVRDALSEAELLVSPESIPEQTIYESTKNLVERRFSEANARFTTNSSAEYSTSFQEDGIEVAPQAPSTLLPNVNSPVFIGGKQGLLVLSKEKVGAWNYWNWMLCVMILLATSIAITFSNELKRIGHRLSNYPKSISLLLATFWWLGLKYSWLGLLVMLLILLCIAKEEWHKYQYRKQSSASTQVPARLT